MSAREDKQKRMNEAYKRLSEEHKDYIFGISKALEFASCLKMKRRKKTDTLCSVQSQNSPEAKCEQTHNT